MPHFIVEDLHRPEAADRNFRSQEEEGSPYVGNWIESRVFTIVMFKSKLIILNSISS